MVSIGEVQDLLWNSCMFCKAVPGMQSWGQNGDRKTRLLFPSLKNMSESKQIYNCPALGGSTLLRWLNPFGIPIPESPPEKSVKDTRRTRAPT